MHDQGIFTDVAYRFEDVLRTEESDATLTYDVTSEEELKEEDTSQGGGGGKEMKKKTLKRESEGGTSSDRKKQKLEVQGKYFQSDLKPFV